MTGRDPAQVDTPLGALEWPCPFCGAITLPHDGESDHFATDADVYSDSSRRYRCFNGHEFEVSIMVLGVTRREPTVLPPHEKAA